MCYLYCFSANLDGNAKTRRLNNSVSPMLSQQYTACFEYTREYRVHFVLRVLGVDFWLYDLDHKVEQATSRSVQQTIPKTARACTSIQTYIPHMLLVHAWYFLFSSAGHWQSRNLPADLAWRLCRQYFLSHVGPRNTPDYMTETHQICVGT